MTASAIRDQSLYSRILWLSRAKTGPDVDNIVKPILDALRAVVFEDDALISQSLVTRIDLSRDYTIVGAGAPAERQKELDSLIASGVDDILYIEIGRVDSHRVVFGLIDGDAV